jgi:voltage-gated potassium channel
MNGTDQLDTLPPAQPADASPNAGDMPAPATEIFLGILSVLAIVNLVLLLVVDDTNLRTVLFVMNGILSVIFLADFLAQMRRATSKRYYFVNQWGWADLAASLPIPQVKILRLFRLIRVVRVVRKYGVKNLFATALHDRASSALLTMVLMGLLVIQFGSLWMLRIEQNRPDTNFQTAGDALWYVVVTMSTVGYGDVAPISNAGRVLGVVIIVIGVGIFGTFTGYLANLFLSPQAEAAAKAEADAAAEADDRDAALHRELDTLRTMVARQEEMLDDIRRRLPAANA